MHDKRAAGVWPIEKLLAGALGRLFVVTTSLQHLHSPSANLFRVEPARQRVLARLKELVVHVGLVGGRLGFKAAEAAFEHMPVRNA